MLSMINLRKYGYVVLPALFLWAVLLTSGCRNASDLKEQETTGLSFFTSDSLEIPAQLIRTPGSSETVLFINGSTPYDEKGNIGPTVLPDGTVLKSPHDFSTRFISIMSAKGYDVATMAKRSFVDPGLPRPTLDELASDANAFINELQKRGLLKDLVIVGYSEGSIIASKLLGLLNVKASACILLGSGSLHFDYFNSKWEEWYKVDILRKDGYTEDQIRKEYEDWSDIMRTLTTMDEESFERKYKNAEPRGFGFAQWESFYIDRDLQFYDPVDHIVHSGVPVLIVIGENDRAMPLTKARITYEALLDAGHDVQMHVIENEVHTYNRYDVFLVMHSWLNGDISLELDTIDRRIIDRYKQISDIDVAINNMPWSGETDSLSTDSVYRQALAIDYNKPGQWFKLGMVLYSKKMYDQSMKAFQRSADPDYVIYFAPLVWQGHLYDLLGKRDQALSMYRLGLENYPGFPVTHDHLGIVLDDNWIKQRMEEAFVYR
jgi:pimeloyl-ACP methyl ester carboxylesterase